MSYTYYRNILHKMICNNKQLSERHAHIQSITNSNTDSIKIGASNWVANTFMTYSIY